VKNLDDLIDFDKVDQFGVNRDPLKGLIGETRGALNENIKLASPELAEALERFSKLKDLEAFLGSEAGKDLSRGELLLKRVFSADKGTDVVELLEQIKRETGIDLVNDAVLARFAMEQFAPDQISLLAQDLQSILAGGTFEGPKGAALQTINRFIGKLSKGDPEKLLAKLLADKRTAGQFVQDLLNGDMTRVIQAIRRSAGEEITLGDEPPIETPTEE